MGRVISGVYDSVCVRTLKGKRRELSTPSSVYTYECVQSLIGVDSSSRFLVGVRTLACSDPGNGQDHALMKCAAGVGM